METRASSPRILFTGIEKTLSYLPNGRWQRVTGSRGDAGGEGSPRKGETVRAETKLEHKGISDDKQRGHKGQMDIEVGGHGSDMVRMIMMMMMPSVENANLI